MSEDLKTTKTFDAFASIFSGNAKIENKEDQIDINKIEDKPEETEKEVATTKIADKSEISKEDVRVDLQAEHELLKKRFDESRSWGHKKNSAYVNAKKKVTEFINQLQEDSIVSEDETKQVLSFFDISDDIVNDSEPVENKENPYVVLKQNLDKEFSLFKKYSKLSEADEKYQAFFSFLPLFPNDEQEKMVNYMMTETPEVVIDNIMLLGADIHDNLYKGAEKNGGIIPFVKSLHTKIEKLEKRNKELETELDTTEGVVHNRSINSKVSKPTMTQNKKSFAEIWSQ